MCAYPIKRSIEVGKFPEWRKRKIKESIIGQKEKQRTDLLLYEFIVLIRQKTSKLKSINYWIGNLALFISYESENKIYKRELQNAYTIYDHQNL